MADQRPSEEQAVGCLLGLMVGDGLGSPFEGLTGDLIYRQFGLARGIVEKPPVEQLCFTDDTQMMVGVAEAMVQSGRIVPEELLGIFAANYDPRRGYGPGTRDMLERLRAGVPANEVSASGFAGGSFGNGAAMRVAPVGVFFFDDTDRLWEEARLSALPTHTHPLGIEGAQLLALAVATAMTMRPFDHAAFFEVLRSRAQQEEYQWLLGFAARLGVEDNLSLLGNGMEAQRSVVTAVACFATAPTSYEDTVARAIGMGNDTDTIAAMAGAISGAHLGVGAIPSGLRTMVEEGEKGAVYVEELARRLWRKRG